MILTSAKLLKVNIACAAAEKNIAKLKLIYEDKKKVKFTEAYLCNITFSPEHWLITLAILYTTSLSMSSSKEHVKQAVS